MTKRFLHLIFGLSAMVTVFAGAAYADSFEFLSYTPPSGWTKQAVKEGIAYQRTSGIGLISIYPSESASVAVYPGESAIGSISADFAKIWRARVEPTLPGTAPQGQVQSKGGYKVAVGGKQVKDSQGAVVIITLTVISAQDRVIGILTMSVGDDVLREITAFFESISVLPEKRDAISAEPPPNSGPASGAARPNSDTVSGGGGIEVDYRVPPGLTAKNDGQMILLTPEKLDSNAPCAYWISPPRLSKGTLEADARAAVLALPLQGQINDERYNAMRGAAPDGWKYFLFGSDIRNSAGTSIAYAMALAFPAGAGQVNIVLGVGNGGSNCYMFDANFVRLFHSLSPRGWTSDSGKAFSRELTGLWRSTGGGAFNNSDNFYLTQYNFMANGRYASGRGSITTTGNLETTTAIASDGSYKLSGGGLTLTSDVSRNISKFRVRVYDDYFAGKWWRKMSLLSEDAKLEMEYERIEN